MRALIDKMLPPSLTLAVLSEGESLRVVLDARVEKVELELLVRLIQLLLGEAFEEVLVQHRLLLVIRCRIAQSILIVVDRSCNLQALLLHSKVHLVPFVLHLTLFFALFLFQF